MLAAPIQLKIAKASLQIKYEQSYKIIKIQINSINLMWYMMLFYWNYIVDVGFKR